MDVAVVVMAAGMGTRFGGGIKQLEPMGPNGESIMEYSIHDAIEAGFDQIVFVLRRDIEEAFRRQLGERMERICARLHVKVSYAFQSLEEVPEGAELPAERTKPWGTGQAVLACRGLVDCPFVVINADDYYGKEAFRQIYAFLSARAGGEDGRLCMAGFVLKNTLSDVGGVTRGICQMKDGYLTGVRETYGIEKQVRDGTVHAVSQGEELDVESLVSMNMWGLTPRFMALLEEGFRAFFAELAQSPDRARRELTAEYLLPVCIDRFLKQGAVSVEVLRTADQWFGVTYREDRAVVSGEFRKLVSAGVYAGDLFSDLLRDGT